VFINPVPFELSAGEVIDELGCGASGRHGPGLREARQLHPGRRGRAGRRRARRDGGGPGHPCSNGAASRCGVSAPGRLRRRGRWLVNASVMPPEPPPARPPMDPRLRARMISVRPRGRPAPSEGRRHRGDRGRCWCWSASSCGCRSSPSAPCG
jgi:hypothetical protein